MHQSSQRMEGQEEDRGRRKEGGNRKPGQKSDNGDELTVFNLMFNVDQIF